MPPSLPMHDQRSLVHTPSIHHMENNSRLIRLTATLVSLFCRIFGVFDMGRVSQTGNSICVLILVESKKRALPLA